MKIKNSEEKEIFVVVKALDTVYQETTHPLDSFEYKDPMDKAIFFGRGLDCKVQEWTHRGNYTMVKVLFDD